MSAHAEDQETLYTVDDVASKCNVSDKTIRRWIREKHLACKLVGPAKRIRITRAELLRITDSKEKS